MVVSRFVLDAKSCNVHQVCPTRFSLSPLGDCHTAIVTVQFCRNLDQP
jgi:hypothetical protein